MTPKQKECLDFLRNWFASREHAPSFDEIRAGLGLASKSGVHRIVEALEAAGLVRRTKVRARSIELTAAATSKTTVDAAARRLIANVEHQGVGAVTVRACDFADLKLALEL